MVALLAWSVDPAERIGRIPCCFALAQAHFKVLAARRAAHEPDLKDLLLGLCNPRHVAAYGRELPPHPEGPLGTFAVMLPKETATIYMDAFRGCSSLAEITLPPALTSIGGYASMV